MNPADRLQARSLLLDEVFAEKSQLEHLLTQERERSKRHVCALRDLIADRSETPDVAWAIEQVRVDR